MSFLHLNNKWKINYARKIELMKREKTAGAVFKHGTYVRRQQTLIVFLTTLIDKIKRLLIAQSPAWDG